MILAVFDTIVVNIFPRPTPREELVDLGLGEESVDHDAVEQRRRERRRATWCRQFWPELDRRGGGTSFSGDDAMAWPLPPGCLASSCARTASHASSRALPTAAEPSSGSSALPASRPAHPMARQPTITAHTIHCVGASLAGLAAAALGFPVDLPMRATVQLPAGW